jgi:hypothetical protein
MKDNTLYAIIIILLLLTISSVFYYESVKPIDCCTYELVCSDKGYTISFDKEVVGFIPLGNTALDSLMIDLNQ